MNNIFLNSENIRTQISAAAAVIGTVLNAVLGGFDKMLYALMAFMLLDFMLGFMAACKSRTVDSRVMFWGGINKLLVLSLVAVGVSLDWLFGHNDPLIRTAVIWFYIGREFLSMTENYGKMGFSLPPFLSEVLEQIENKSAVSPDDKQD